VAERDSGAIIIAGHSHAATLVGSSSHPKGDVCLLPVAGHDRIYGLHGPLLAGFAVRTGYYWTALARYAPGNSVALFYGGNEHHANFLFEQAPRFDFVPKGLQSLPVEADAVIVSESLIRAKFRSLLGSPLQGLLAYLTRQAHSRITLIGTPPPRRDYDGFQSLFISDHPQVKLTSSIKLLKLWHVLQEILREQAEGNGVEFIAVPDGITDEDGFLKPEFTGTDATHGNQAYGQLMLNYLAQRL
jgi:hypothetical protein